MKRMIFIVLTAALLLGVLPLQAGMPLADLTALARYFPADAPVFIAFRTDDDMINELDNVIARVAAKLPEGAIPPDVQLTSLLNMGTAQVFGEDFQTAVRPWLGDTAVLGFTSSDAFMMGEPDYLIAVSITDRAQAEAAVQTLLEQSGNSDSYQTTNQNGFTLIAPKPDYSYMTGALAIGDEVIFFGGKLESLPLAGIDGETLADSASFNETDALLPEDAYDMMVYVAIADIMRPMAGMMSAESDMPVDPAAMFDVMGSMALGITILDERSMVMDIAFKTGDLSVLKDLGMDTTMVEPIDPAFTAFIPADSMWVAQGTNLKRLYEGLLTSARFNADPEQFDADLAEAKAQIKQFTQLDLDEDIIGWMTGDTALFITVDMPVLLDAIAAPSPDGDMTFQEFPFGFGLLIEATDSARAQKLAETLGTLLPLMAQSEEDVTIVQEDIAGTTVTVINAPLEMGSDAGEEAMMTNIVIGATEDYFLIATRAEAKAILSGSPGLDTTPPFVEASQYILDDPSFMWYSPSIMSPSPPLLIVGLTMAGPAIGDVFENIVTELESPGSIPTLTPEELERQEQARLEEQRRNRAILEGILSIASSSSVSTAQVGEDDLVIRSVITLAE